MNNASDAAENDSIPPEDHSSPFPFDISLLYKYIVPVLIVLAGASALLNGTILMLHYCVRRPLSTTLKLTFGLAAADLATSTILTFNFIINSFLPVVYEINIASGCFTIALEALRLGSIFTSILHLLLLTVNHYMAIAHAATYKRKLSSRIVAALMVAFWALPSVCYLIGFSVVPGQGLHNGAADCPSEFLLNFWFRLVVVMSTLIGPASVMMLLYLRMLRLLSSLQEQFSGDSRRNKAIKRKRKALTTTVFMVGSYLLGWVPACLFYLMTSHYWHEQFRRIPLVLIIGNFCVNFLLIAKFLLNPLIYAVRVPEIKALLWRHGPMRQFRRRRSSGDGEEATALYDSFVVHVGGSNASSNLRSVSAANANSVHVENEISVVDFDRYDVTKITKQL